MSAPVLGTTYADAAQLAAWFDNARPGQRCVYARGCGLRQDNPAVVLTARWRDAGDAITTQNRLGDADFEYLVTRCESRAAIKARVPANREAKALALAGTPEGELLDYVRGLMTDGLPMPVNTAIADELGWRDKHQVRYRLNQLQLCGLLTIGTGKAEERIVTCTITGRATASIDTSRDRDSGRGSAALRSATAGGRA